MFISEEQKTKLPSFENQNIGFHGDVVSSRGSIHYTTLSIYALHVRMYKPLGYVYVTCTNLDTYTQIWNNTFVIIVIIFGLILCICGFQPSPPFIRWNLWKEFFLEAQFAKQTKVTLVSVRLRQPFTLSKRKHFHRGLWLWSTGNHS